MKHALCHVSAAFHLRSVGAHCFDGHANDLDVNIQAIDQRAREPRAITLHLFEAAVTFGADIVEIAARPSRIAFLTGVRVVLKALRQKGFRGTSQTIGAHQGEAAYPRPLINTERLGGG